MQAHEGNLMLLWRRLWMKMAIYSKSEISRKEGGHGTGEIRLLVMYLSYIHVRVSREVMGMGMYDVARASMEKKALNRGPIEC